MKEDEMVEWHHQLNGHEFEQALGNNEGLGSLACCSPWGLKESDVTEGVNSSSTLMSLKTFPQLHTLPQSPVL